MPAVLSEAYAGISVGLSLTGTGRAMERLLVAQAGELQIRYIMTRTLSPYRTDTRSVR